MSKLLLSTLLFSILVIYTYAECPIVTNGACECGSANGDKFKYYTRMNNPLSARFKRSLVARKSKEGDWPWIVQVFGKKFCSGTIINERWVLTSAECVTTKYKNRIRYGFGHVDKLKIVEASRVIVHEGYHKESDTFVKDDVALLELKEPFVFDDKIYSICIGKDVTPNDGELAVVAGYGEMFYKLIDFERTKDVKTLLHSDEMITTGPDYLRETPVPILKSCDTERTTKDAAELDKIVCSGDSGHGTTAGDEGGPLMVIRGKTWTLFGVVSTRWNTAVKEDLLAIMANDVYTKIGKYCPWIEEKTSGQVTCK